MDGTIMLNDRFVNIKRVVEIQKQKEYLQSILNELPGHCRDCGDTKPKHLFYPLMGMAYPSDQTSLLICNRCALTDEEYEKRFKEKKEIIP